MKRIIALATFLLLVLTFDGRLQPAFAQTAGNPSADVPVYARLIIDAYAEQGLKYENNAIVFPDGTALLFDDKKSKRFEQALNEPDIEDMLQIPYKMEGIPDFQEDPGRIRVDAFFKKMYGASAAEVKKKLVSIPWFGTTIKFTSVNHAAEQLQKVAAEIETLYPELKKYMASSGTFFWRKVRHSSRMSAHSYGIAIDIGVKFSNYWKWTYPKADENTLIEYQNKIPMQIVDIFEKYGFVWGGRWYHFDTMHFEYRPEIIANAKSAGVVRKDEK